MKHFIVKSLKYFLITVSFLWFIFINIISFASYDFYLTGVTSLFHDVPSQLLPCHTRAQQRSSYGRVELEDPNRAFYNLLPVTQMDYMEGSIENEWYIDYRQYFLFIPIGVYRFPCEPGETFP